jgi:hypothetical protein
MIAQRYERQFQAFVVGPSLSKRGLLLGTDVHDFLGWVEDVICDLVN